MTILLSIEMFGGFRVQIGDRTISRFTTQKAAALLAYLAYRAGQHPREVLADLLWPDSEPEAGRASLSQALSMLRRQLEPPGVRAGSVIVASKTHVGLNPGATDTDVGKFQRAIRRARLGENRLDRIEALREALGAYAGELLPGFYEDWVQTEQRRLAEMYFQAVKDLLGLLEDRGDIPQALDYARRAVAMEPLREDGHQQVMRLCVASGRPGDALDQYRELERILNEELGERPSPAMQRLAREIESAAESPVAASLPTSKTPGRIRNTLPRGTVTFLLTDIAGSTASWEQAGNDFQRALETHNRILRKCFTAHDGHEVRDGGDSFLVAFESPTSAIACAIAAQLALHDSQLSGSLDAAQLRASGAVNPRLKTRMALHTGEVKLEDREYHGIALHRVTRILTAAHGGQILVSEALATMVRRDLPSGVRLVDMGIFRLRDVQAPERLFQVNYDGMTQTDFPRLHAEAGYQSNLPLQFTRFFGREEQLAQLGEILQWADTRLVTITGSGGTGKTRLALEAGNRLLEPFAGAVWFVPLVDLTDARLIAGAVVDSMRIQRSPTVDPLDQAVEALNRQSSLLILDNLEQFVEEGGKVIHTLLERVPLLTCLVTSRQSLRLSGEREYPLAPLATPNGPGTPDRLTMFESVRLFVDRAQAVRPDFQVTNQNAPAVAELCDRLEGIPLAIELAAARASVLSPAKMLLQLERRFDFLVSRLRDAAERHRTLRAAFDWSYELLPAEIQRFFVRLSVFRGGWTVDAAEAVCVSEMFEDMGSGPGHALDHLALLRDCSLILAEESVETMRFGIMVTLREYAEERLSPDERAAAQQRHFDFFLHLAEEAELKLSGPEQALWLDALAVEHDNLRTALDRCQTAESGLRLSAALKQFWEMRGYWSEGRERLRHAMARPGAQDRTAHRAKVLNGAGSLAIYQGDYAAARALLEESLSIRRALRDRQGVAGSLNDLGIVARDQGDYSAARALLEESLSIRRKLGDRQGVAGSLNNLGGLAIFQGNCATARQFYEESLAIRREEGDRQGIARTLNNLGIVAQDQGDYTAACQLLEESLVIFRVLGNKNGIAYVLHLQGIVANKQGDYAAARRLYEESLAIQRELGHSEGIAGSLNNLGSMAERQGEYAAARQFYEECLAIFRAMGNKNGIAGVLEGFASLAASQERPAHAARLWGAAEALREQIGAPVPPNDQEEYNRWVDIARERVGAEAFAAAWGEGRKMMLDEAIEHAIQEYA